MADAVPTIRTGCVSRTRADGRLRGDASRHGRVAKLANAQALGACPERVGGSTPLSPIHSASRNVFNREGETRNEGSYDSHREAVGQLNKISEGNFMRV